MPKQPQRGRPRFNGEKRQVKSLSMNPKSWAALKAHKKTIKAKSLGLANEDAIKHLGP